MTTRRKNRKNIIFLLALTIFAICFSKLVNKYKYSNLEEKEEIAWVNTYSMDNVGVVEEHVDEDSINIIFLDPKYTIDITDMLDDSQLVLAEVDNPEEVCHINNSLTSDVILCNEGGGDLVEGYGRNDGSGLVSQDALFKLVTVTYPLPLWLGSYSYTSSTKEISTIQSVSNNYNYRGAGEQIDVEYQTKTLSPNEAKKVVEQVEELRRTDYEITNVILNTEPDSAETQQAGEYGIHNMNDAKGDCVEEVAIYDYNVGTPNLLGYDEENGGYLRGQKPNGDNYVKTLTDSEKFCFNVENEIKEIEKGFGVACGINLSRSSGTWKDTFEGSLWEKCTVCKTRDGNGNCIEAADPTLCKNFQSTETEIPMIYGDPLECDKENETCANAFLSYVYMGTLTPKSSSALKASSSDYDKDLTLFVATKCQAGAVSEEGSQKLGDRFNMYCIWDATPFLLVYNLERKDKAPNQKDFPFDFQTYWQQVLDSALNSAKYYHDNYNVYYDLPIDL